MGWSTMENAGPCYLSVCEAAGYLGVHEDTILRAIAAGRLRAGMLLRRYRIKQSDLDEFVSRKKCDGSGQ